MFELPDPAKSELDPDQGIWKNVFSFGARYNIKGEYLCFAFSTFNDKIGVSVPEANEHLSTYQPRSVSRCRVLVQSQLQDNYIINHDRLMSEAVPIPVSPSQVSVTQDRLQYSKLSTSKCRA